VAAALAGPLLLMTELEALGQTGLVIFSACALAFPSALGLAPVFFCVGFGPSRVWLKALFIYLRWQIAAFSSARSEDDGVSSQEDPKAALAISVLGPPFTNQLARARGEVPTNRRAMSLFQRTRSFFMGPGPSGESMMMDVGSEGGPHILALDVHGATAMPPYHVVMTVRDKFAGEG